MNRLLQHFVDSNGEQRVARPPMAAPPLAQNQTPQSPWASAGPAGLEDIPLTSQSGDVYETVDLNADSRSRSLFHASHTPGKTQLYQSPTAGSASDLFNGPPPAKELFGAPRSGGSNPYRRQSGQKDAFAAFPSAPKDPFASPMQNGDGQKDPFATSHSENTSVFGNGPTASAHDPFAAQPPKETQFPHMQQPQQTTDPFAGQQMQQSQQSANPFAAPSQSASSNGSESAHDPFAAQLPKETKFPHTQQPQQTTDPFAAQQMQQQPQQPAEPFAAPPRSNSPFGSSPSNGLASADSLFASPAPTNDWSQSPPHPQPPAQAQELFASDAPSASSLFGGDAPSSFQMNHSNHSSHSSRSTPPKPQSNPSHLPNHQGIVPPSPVKPQDSAPSPAQFPAKAPPSPMKPPVAPPSPMINASSPPKPQVAVPASPVMRPEDHLTPALGSMKLATPAKSPLKPGLDVRSMKFPAGKRDDDAISNAPSIAMSRMSMLSTLDDSLKLSDMYKQMTSRLEGEKHDLLKVVASQAQEIAQMKKHIMSLELQLKKSRPQGA